jgi:signal transduction histidine kinase
MTESGSDVKLDAEGLRLEVCDNGVGFDPQALYLGHLGLRSMRERATRVGGTLDIVSVPDCGTQVRTYIPVPFAQAV